MITRDTRADKNIVIHFFIFDIRMSVHRNIIPKYSQQDAKFLYLFLKTLYMFQAVPPPIIRNT